MKLEAELARRDASLLTEGEQKEILSYIRGNYDRDKIPCWLLDLIDGIARRDEQIAELTATTHSQAVRNAELSRFVWWRHCIRCDNRGCGVRGVLKSISILNGKINCITGWRTKTMTDKNANTEIRKEFCPNCEAEVPCTHEAELYVCDICGEDFAKYIVSRNCNVSDVSMTRDVSTDIKTPSSIENTNPDYYKQEIARRDEIITRLKVAGNNMYFTCSDDPYQVVNRVHEAWCALMKELE